MDDARQTAYVLGMPDLPIVEMSRCLTNLSNEDVLEIAKEIKPLVIAALTTEVANEEGGASLPSSEPPLISFSGEDQFGALAAFQEGFLQGQLGDGFPLIPPTPEAVEEMLTGTALGKDHVIAVLEPGMGQATVEKIAINAVMAGCKAEHLPIILAATTAIAEKVYCLRGIAMSTGPHAPLMVVSGPIAKKLGVNSGRGALGPSRESAVNIVLGRALRLVMVNCGYTYLGIFDLDTIGAPRKFSMCFAENEDESPFPPIHVDHGFEPDESCVTMFSVESEIECQDLANSEPEALLRTYAGSVGIAGSASVQHTYLELVHGHTSPQNLFLVPPEHAKIIGDAGWSKQEAIDFVYRESFREAKWVLNAVMPQSMRPDKRWAADLEPDAKIPVIDGVGSLRMVVVGGASGKAQYYSGVNEPVTKSVTAFGLAADAAALKQIAAEGWATRMGAIIDTMVAPLVNDGGKFEVVTATYESRQLAISADFADCPECAMTDEDLAALLQEGLRRTDPEALVEVRGV